MQQRTVCIPAIGCEGCIRAIRAELAELEGVIEVQADLAQKLVQVTWQAPATWEAIRARLVEINYPPEELTLPT
ncbi:MAG: heavy metal-associated domain-containing protein [Anaerolineae bacterium]|nr:heavy-metal-associated domain-containing protein [Thermoflexales bacterium]MDW8396444.1 heavy metal-associated domain-containing protein [Anaerolineae bacterium]